MAATTPNVWNKEDNANSPLVFSKGSHLQQRGSVAASLPSAGDNTYIGFDTVGSWTQYTANDTVFLGVRSLEYGAREFRTQYMVESLTQHTSKNITGPG